MNWLLSLLSPAGDHGRLSILIFHRVAHESDELFPEEMSARKFDKVCRWLSAGFNVLPLDVAARKLSDGSLPSRAVCVTFDDGYADNHDVALPILRRHGLVATFFVSTGFLDGGLMWNDILIEAIRRCSLRELDATGIGGLEDARFQLDSPASRRTAIDYLLASFKYLPLSSRQEAVEAVANRAGAELPSNLMMTTAQVRSLHQAGMQIGAHTVAHPILSLIDTSAALREMAESRQQLEAIVHGSVKLFAYPNGQPDRDYGPRDVSLAQECGYTAAVTTAPGAARRGSSVFELPRFTPWRKNRAGFVMQLACNLCAVPSR